MSESTATAEVFGGPVPNSADVWSIAQSPTSCGYEKLGFLGPASPLVSELTGAGHYQYLLIKFTTAQIPRHICATMRFSG